MVKKTVSHSEAESFLHCERQHYYGYGLEIQPLHQSDALSRGTLGHACLEVFFKHLLNVDQHDIAGAQTAVWEFLKPQYAVQPILASEVTQCLTFFFQAYPFMGWAVIGVEYDAVLEVTDDIAVPFVVDLIIRDIAGKVWAIDHKFVYDFINETQADLMPQLAKYAVGLKMLGIHVDNFAYSCLRYRSMKDNNAENRYRFQPFVISNARQMQTLREQALIAQRIQRYKAMPIEQWSYEAVRANDKKVCQMCSFRSLCIAELNDSQPNLVLNNFYKKRQRRDWKAEETKEETEE